MPVFPIYPRPEMNTRTFTDAAEPASARGHYLKSHWMAVLPSSAFEQPFQSTEDFVARVLFAERR